MQIETDLPRKLPKKPKPVRVGYAYVGRRADDTNELDDSPRLVDE